MFNNGQCYIWLPSFLTLAALSDQAATTINAVHTALGLPGQNFQEGQQNPYILTLNDLDMGGAPFTRGTGSELACCGPINNKSFLSIQYLSLIVAFGGDVEGFPVYFELNDLDQPCPFYEGTWAELQVADPTQEFIEIEGKWYRSSNFGQTGQPLNASAWVAQLANGLTVLTVEQYLELRPAVEL